MTEAQLLHEPALRLFVFIYLFERKWLCPLLWGSRLPHTDGGAGAAGDNQLWVWTYGTEDLAPLWQTLVHNQRLKQDGTFKSVCGKLKRSTVTASVLGTVIFKLSIHWLFILMHLNKRHQLSQVKLSICDDVGGCKRGRTPPNYLSRHRLRSRQILLQTRSNEATNWENRQEKTSCKPQTDLKGGQTWKVLLSMRKCHQIKI